MPWAVDFLPCHIIELTNFVTRSDPIDRIRVNRRALRYVLYEACSQLSVPGSQLTAVAQFT